MIQRWHETFNSLKKYNLNKILSASNAAQLYVYGSGSFALNLVQILNKHGYQVQGFLDHQTNSNVLMDMPTIEAEDITPHNRLNVVIIIGIHNRDADINKIILKLNNLGFKNIVTPIDIYDNFFDELGTRFWLTQRSFYKNHEEIIETAYNLLCDEKSKDYFEAIMNFRINGDYSKLPEPDIVNQYFPIDIMKITNPLRLIDCGAFDGDTLRLIINHGLPLEAVAAFEPDQFNFLKLVKTVQSHNIPNAILWPCGVFSKTTQMFFSPDNNEGGSISNNGTSLIQCVSLNDAIPNFSPTMIKMDIEGAEIEALLGAKDIILKHKPLLAISVYHQPEHIWEIPVLIASWNLGYKFYIRLHGQSTFDSVLYAIQDNQ